MTLSAASNGRAFDEHVKELLQLLTKGKLRPLSEGFEKSCKLSRKSRSDVKNVSGSSCLEPRPSGRVAANGRLQGRAVKSSFAGLCVSAALRSQSSKGRSVLAAPELPWPVPFLLLNLLLCACPACVGRLCSASLDSLLSSRISSYLFALRLHVFITLLLFCVVDKLQ